PARAEADRNGGDGVAAGVEWVRLDLEQPETFAPALAGVDAVFMVARPGDDEADRVAAPLVDALVREGVARVVDLSALGAELRPDFALRRVELMLEGSGVAWTHLRPNWFMQVFSTPPLLDGIRARGELCLPAGDARLSFVDARDVAAVAAVALCETGHAGKAYALTGGEALDHAQVAAEIGRASGRAVRYRPLGEAAARAALASSGFGPGRVERLIGFYRLVRGGACAPVSADVATVLGRPPIGFRTFACTNASLWRD
ncbi:MAG TPA: NAD(P)H-binding protein, partial [Longimicrobiales bacterium]